MTTKHTIPLLIAVALLAGGCSVKMKMSDITGVPPKPERERVLVRVQVPGPTVGGEIIPLPLATPLEDQASETTNLDGHVVSNAVAVVGGAVVFGRLEPHSTQTARTPAISEKMENKR